MPKKYKCTITETEIEKTITRALNKIGVPVNYSKISAIDEEGIIIVIEFKEAR